MAAEARIRAQDDADMGPSLPQPRHQQLQYRPGMFGAVDVRRPQIAHQQLIAAEHIERQEAVAIVVAVKEPSLLFAMHRIVGGVEVEHQFIRRRIKGGDEGLDHRHVGGPRPGAIRRPIQAADRRRAGEPPIAPDRRL